MQQERHIWSWQRLAALALMAALASCVAPRQPAPPPPPRRPAPALPPLPAAPPPSSDWRDWPLSPGTWRYAPEGGGTAARYGRAGDPALIVRCRLGTRTITLSRISPAAEAALVDITTSAGRQSFRATPGQSEPGVVVTLAARDPFLDKMAFSRGRFVVAAGGTARLVVPAWPEFARVVEDCRG